VDQRLSKVEALNSLKAFDKELDETPNGQNGYPFAKSSK
jgi:hypothetical protein